MDATENPLIPPLPVLRERLAVNSEERRVIKTLIRLATQRDSNHQARERLRATFQGQPLEPQPCA